MAVYFSRHARRQMKWRRVTEAEVLRVLDSPTRVEDSSADRKNAYKLIDARLLKVTYKYERSDIIVITVIEKENRSD